MSRWFSVWANAAQQHLIVSSPIEAMVLMFEKKKVRKNDTTAFETLVNALCGGAVKKHPMILSLMRYSFLPMSF
jgi:hypothetical protein